MKKRGNEAASRILGFMVMPVLAGMLFGSYLAFRIYSGFIENVEASCIDEVSVNYGHPITIGDFFTDVPKNARFITNVSQIDTGILASYDVAIDCDGHVMHSILNVVDLTGPAAVAVPCRMYCGEAPAPETLVKNIFDMSDVTVEYDQGAPDFTTGGDYDVGVRLTDGFGNVTVVQVPVTVIDDHNAPVITGAHDIEFVIGGTVSYRDGITVKDDYDDNPTLTIDNSGVNLDIAGTYPLIYKASDEAGNETSVTVNVNVVVRPSAGLTDAEDVAVIQQAYDLATDVLSDITEPGDTDVEIAMHIFYWSYHHLGFARGTSDYTSWAHAAVKAFTTRTSSCYGHWAVCKAMLDVAGIENICVTRFPDTWAVHYWSLVKLNGGWYHCDPQAWDAENNWGLFVFMCTDEELAAMPGNHDFDETLYPERATTSVQQYVDVYTDSISPDFPYSEG